jgi:hypothetical protein
VSATPRGPRAAESSAVIRMSAQPAKGDGHEGSNRSEWASPGLSWAAMPGLPWDEFTMCGAKSPRDAPSSAFVVRSGGRLSPVLSDEARSNPGDCR